MYKTQMEAARKGIITKEMEAVAAKEYRTPEEIRELVAKGQVAICANRLHKCIEPILASTFFSCIRYISYIFL